MELYSRIVCFCKKKDYDKMSILSFIRDYLEKRYVDASEEQILKLSNKVIDVYEDLCYEYYSLNKRYYSVVDIQNSWRVSFLKKQHNYLLVQSILVDTKLISRSSSYLNGNIKKDDGTIKKAYCKSYKINDDLFFKLDFEKSSTKEYWIDKYPDMKNIIEMIYQTSFDEKEVASFLYDKKNRLTNNNKKITPKLIKHYLYLVKAFNSRRFKKEMIDHDGKKKSIFKLTNEGRFYNPVCFLPSLIRPFLKYRGEYLTEIDLKNSQPLLLATTVKNRKFKIAVEKGKFYDVLAKELNIHRNEIKKLVMKYVLFGKNTLKSGKIYNAMTNKYGNLIHQINRLKQENNYELWAVLQKKEADIFIKSLNDHNNNYIPIHDSILVTGDKVEYYLDKLDNIFKNMDIKPSFTKKSKQFSNF
jgi:hypothetical protein